MATAARARKCSTEVSNADGVDRALRPVELSSGVEFVKDHLAEPGPDTGPRSPGEAVVHRGQAADLTPAATPPSAADRHHEHDHRQHLAITVPTTAPCGGRLPGQSLRRRAAAGLRQDPLQDQARSNRRIDAALSEWNEPG